MKTRTIQGVNSSYSRMLAVGQDQVHEHRVQGDVEHRAQGDAEARLPGHAHAAHQVGHDVGEHGRHRPQNDNAEGILPGVEEDVAPCPEEPQRRAHGAAQPQGKCQRQDHPQPEAESADPAGFLLLAGAQQPGEQRTAADARQGGKTGQHVEDRQNQRSPRQHIGVIGAADIKGIGHVVDQHNDLTDGGRHDHLSQRHRHRQGLKQFLFVHPGDLLFP